MSAAGWTGLSMNSQRTSLEKNKKHDIAIVVDRLVIREDIARRLTDSVETAASLAGVFCSSTWYRRTGDLSFSQNYACEDCGVSMEELAPRMFSFNNPFGACPTCTGLGSQMKADPQLVIPNPALSILDGAIAVSGWNSMKGDSIARMYFEALGKQYGFQLTTPFQDLSPGGPGGHPPRHRGEKLKLTMTGPTDRARSARPLRGIYTTWSGGSGKPSPTPPGSWRSA